MFGERLRRLRIENSVKQAELGEFLGVTSNTISNWELGVTSPNPETIEKIVKYFNTTPNYLFGFNEDDLEKIDKLRIVLKEFGLNVKDDLSIEDLNKALQIVEILENDKDTK